MKLNSGPQSENKAKNIKWQETVFLKSTILRKRGRNGELSLHPGETGMVCSLHPGETGMVCSLHAGELQ